MDLLLVLTYTGICILIFRIFRIGVTAITLLTAALGGFFLIGLILLGMNYNHPFSSQGRFYFNTTPIVPLVSGRVIEAPLRAGDQVKKGDVLFTLEPTSYQAAVDNHKAALADAEQRAKELTANREAAESRLAEASARRDRTQADYERVAKIGPGAVSQQEIQDSQFAAESAAANYASAQSELTAARLEESSTIGGVNTAVARLQADLAKAEFDLEQTVMRAPTDGSVEQSFLREGMMAVSLPLRPVMVFNHAEPPSFAAAFLPNCAQRLDPGSAAEVAFPAVPGRIFHAKIKRLQDVIAQGQLQPTGTLIAPESIHGEGRIVAVLEFDSPEELAQYRLVPGATGITAVYSDHLREFAIIRKVLLRMKSWTHYLFSDGH